MNVAKAQCVEVDCKRKRSRLTVRGKKYVGKVQRRGSGIAN